MITTAADFALVLKYLPIDKRNEVYDSLGTTRVLDMIKTAGDFALVLKYLSADQCKEVCRDLQTHLSNIITTANAFSQILGNLSFDQCKAVCQALKTHLPTIITTENDLASFDVGLFPYTKRIIQNQLKTIAVENFLKDPGVLQSDFWRNQDAATITMQMIIDRAKKPNSQQFFADNTSNETKKLLVNLGVALDTVTDEKTITNSMIVALLHLPERSSYAQSAEM